MIRRAEAVPEADAVAGLRIRLLGGFRVEKMGFELPGSVWQRRAAKRVTKLLATAPRHTLHREQILEILWPRVDLESARNSFAKALHAARRALEPDRLPRGSSAYFHLQDDMLTLDTEHVLIDADQFQSLGESALRQETVAGYETALAAYTGELLPEDRYEDWSAARRDYLAELSVLLLLRLAEALERRGDRSQAVDRLRALLQQDPTREDAHRRLMNLYVDMGARSLAVRQFEICREVLRKLNLVPDGETEALYEEVVAHGHSHLPTLEPRAIAIPSQTAAGAEEAIRTPLIGRGHQLQLLHSQLSRARAGNGGAVLVSGETGVGKTRLVADFVASVQGAGVSVIGGEHGGHTSRLPYGPFAVALEGFLATRAEADRAELAARYPALTQLIPSLEPATALPLQLNGSREDDAPLVFTEIVRLLMNLCGTRPVIVVLGDLDDAHASSFELLEYLANLAAHRRWLLIGTSRDDAIGPGGELSRMLEATTREQLCTHVQLQCLAKVDCDELVRTLLPGGVVKDSLLDRIYTLSLGNPLFVEELVRELRERNALALSACRWQESRSLTLPVPARVRALVQMRVASLDRNVRGVLELAAVAGTEITLVELRRAASSLRPPLSNVELCAALDEALGSRMLVEGQDTYTFRHPLVRAALCEELSYHRRVQLGAALKRFAGSARDRERAESSATRLGSKATRAR
jgi:DNA-binding SARP family transcriptional activator